MICCWYWDCKYNPCFLQVCPRGQRTDDNKICRECVGSPDRYDWLYLGFMAMLPLVLHWFFIEWYSGKKRFVYPFSR